MKKNAERIYGKTNPKRTQTNPICRGVASGEAGSKPISNGARVAFEAVALFCAGERFCPIIVLFIKLQATNRAVLLAFSADEEPFLFFV